jgi:hypothetical protein
MRKALLTFAAAATMLSAGALFSTSANAMALPAPGGIRHAIVDASLFEDVRYVCRRYRVCGYYGCRWRTRCYYTRPYRRYYRRYYY